MYIETLKISNFRNLTSLELKLNPGVHILHGANGSGKTNILEAIFVLHLGRSHRSAAEAVMVAQDAGYYRLESNTVCDGRTCEVAVAYEIGGRKKISIDQVAVRIRELYQTFSVVALSPEDSDILAGPPSGRRRFVDLYLSQYSSKYLAALTDYHKALAQKNAALKKEMDPQPFNELMVDTGSWIMTERAKYLGEVSRMACDYYARIAGGGKFDTQYKPSVSVATDSQPDQIQQAFRRSLSEAADRERITQTALVGIHRDEVVFSVNSLPARTHGSQGEWRSAAIALKLAVYNLIKERREARPILLLDEVFAELDAERSEALMQAIDDFEQLFLTTALEPPEFLRRSGVCHEVAGGQIVGVK